MFYQQIESSLRSYNDLYQHHPLQLSMDGITMAAVSVVSWDRMEQNVWLRFRIVAGVLISLNYLDSSLGSPSLVSIAGSFLVMNLSVLISSIHHRNYECSRVCYLSPICLRLNTFPFSLSLFSVWKSEQLGKAVSILRICKKLSLLHSLKTGSRFDYPPN
jgi:hypothetical protein